MQKLIMEKNKKPGVLYAFTDDGWELPIINITHPAFALENKSKEEIENQLKKMVEEQARHNRLPGFLKMPMLWLLSRNSVLMKGLVEAQGSFLSGMNTYLMKLGPDHFGQGYAGKMDRKFAASISISMYLIQLRLRDAAETLAQGLVPLLRSKPSQPILLINLAGGPCFDSLNALILVQKQDPALLSGRKVMLYVYDRELSGPSFGKQALDALSSARGPLAGLDADMVYRYYDWAHPELLMTSLDSKMMKNAVVAFSSEGGLGDYGSDQEIKENLRVISVMTPGDVFFMLTFCRADGPGAAFNQFNPARIMPRSLEDIKDLIKRAGWEIGSLTERPLSYVVGIKKPS